MKWNKSYSTTAIRFILVWFGVVCLRHFRCCLLILWYIFIYDCIISFDVDRIRHRWFVHDDDQAQGKNTLIFWYYWLGSFKRRSSYSYTDAQIIIRTIYGAPITHHSRTIWNIWIFFFMKKIELHHAWWWFIDRFSLFLKAMRLKPGSINFVIKIKSHFIWCDLLVSIYFLLFCSMQITSIWVQFSASQKRTSFTLR